jgi:hypothetical protein
MKIEDVMNSTAPGEQGGDADVPPGMEEVSADEQVAYEKVVLAGMRILYGDSTRERVLKSIEAQADMPAQAMGTVITMIMVQMDEKSGGMIPEEVILPAAAELLEHLGELVDAAKVATVDQDVLGQAAQFMLMGMAEQYDFDPDEVKAVLDGVPPNVIEKIVAEQGGYAGKTSEAAGATLARGGTAAPAGGAPEAATGSTASAPAKGNEPVNEEDV